MIKKIVLFLCLSTHFCYSFDADVFTADTATPTFDADTPKNRWELCDKNIALTDAAIRLIDAENHYPKKEILEYQTMLGKRFIELAAKKIGKNIKEIPLPLINKLIEELFQRKAELQEADFTRKNLPGILCLFM